MHPAFHARPRRPRRAALLGAVYAAGLGACYSYAPPPAGAPPAGGADVRAVLTDAGSTQLTGVLGPRVAFVEGTLLEGRADSLVVRTARTETFDGRETAWNGERVALPAAALASVRTRQLDRTRTVIAVAAGAAALVISAASFRTKTDDNGGKVTVSPLPGAQ